jgi:hypothetical protein
MDYASITTIIKAIVGSGLLALPNAVEEFGWIGGILGLFIQAILSLYTMKIVIKVSLFCVKIIIYFCCCFFFVRRLYTIYVKEKGSTNVYCLLMVALMLMKIRVLMMLSVLSMMKSVSKLWERLDAGGDCLQSWQHRFFIYIVLTSSDYFFLFLQYGACIAYLTFVLNRGHEVLRSFGTERWELLLCILPVLLILVNLRSTKSLAPTAHIGNISMIVGVIAVFWYGIEHTDGIQPIDTYTSVDMSNAAMFFGITGMDPFSF